MPIDRIVIRGAREHNLKNVTVEIPRDKFVVLTGISGSGKSSLAFDTIYAEGQRKYVESLSAYARQFLGLMEKPDVDHIDGLSPAVSIDQKGAPRNPRSTVGTVTEVYDYLRLLYARVGQPHCPVCGKPISRQSREQIVDRILALPEESRIQVLGPIVRGRKGEYRQLFEDLRRQGFARVRVDGIVYEIGEDIPLDKNKKHWIEVVVDRIITRPDVKTRLADSLETALKLGQGIVYVDVLENGNAGTDNTRSALGPHHPRLAAMVERRGCPRYRCPHAHRQWNGQCHAICVTHQPRRRWHDGLDIVLRHGCCCNFFALPFGSVFMFQGQHRRNHRICLSGHHHSHGQAD